MCCSPGIGPIFADFATQRCSLSLSLTCIPATGSPCSFLGASDGRIGKVRPIGTCAGELCRLLSFSGNPAICLQAFAALTSCLTCATAHASLPPHALVRTNQPAIGGERHSSSGWASPTSGLEPVNNPEALRQIYSSNLGGAAPATRPARSLRPASATPPLVRSPTATLRFGRPSTLLAALLSASPSVTQPHPSASRARQRGAVLLRSPTKPAVAAVPPNGRHTIPNPRTASSCRADLPAARVGTHKCSTTRSIGPTTWRTTL